MSDSNDFADATATTVTDGAGSGNGSSGRRRSTGLAGMLLPELKALAGDLGISGTGQMRKGQLIEAIQARQSGGNGAAPAAEPRERGGRASRERTSSAARDAAQLFEAVSKASSAALELRPSRDTVLAQSGINGCTQIDEEPESRRSL